MGQDVYTVHMNHDFKKVIQIYKNHDNSRDFLFYVVFIKNFTTLYLFYMANGTTYGINFPFSISPFNFYFDLSETTEDEIRSNLLHLILTRKGSRYFLPDFGTRIYEFIFDPLDGETFEGIKSDIQEQIEKYLPGLIINDISVKPYLEADESVGEINYSNLGQNGDILANEFESQYEIYKVPGSDTYEYTAKLRIDYTVGDSTFSPSQFIIINI